MEVKFNAGDMCAIPDGCKATIKDGVVIFEKIQEFKDGDILVYADYLDYRCPFIYKGADTRGRHQFYVGVNSAKRIVLSDNAEKRWGDGALQQATEEEKQTLFDKMKEQGLQWNAEEKRVEQIRWRAEEGKDYFFVDGRGDIVEYEENGNSIDYDSYEFGNYFRTEGQAKEAERRMKEVLHKYHEEIGE